MGLFSFLSGFPSQIKGSFIRRHRRLGRKTPRIQSLCVPVFRKNVHSSRRCFRSRLLFFFLIVTFTAISTNIFLRTETTGVYLRGWFGKGNHSSAASYNDESSFSCRNLFPNGSIILVWAFNEPRSPLLLQRSLEAIIRTNPNVNTKVFCASSICIDLVNQLNYACAKAERLVLTQLMIGTPLEQWAREHVLMKLLSVHFFEAHVQFAAQLAALWRYGGTMLAPGVIPTRPIPNNSWIAIRKQQFFLQHDITDNQHIPTNSSWSLKTKSKGFYALSAHPRAPYLQNAMESVWKKAKQPYSRFAWPVTFNWNQIMMNAASEVICNTTRRKRSENSTCVIVESLHELGLAIVEEESLSAPFPSRNYGTLTYNARRTYLLSKRNPGMNIGDEIQGLAGIQFLPYVNAFVERDRMDIVRLTNDIGYANDEYVATSNVPKKKPPEVTIFLNAWYASDIWVWPPPPQIDPILVAMHFEEGRKDRIAKERWYLADKGLIGARDKDTDGFLSSQGIHSVFAGCLTLTFQPLDPERKHNTGEVLIVDVNEKLIAGTLPQNVIRAGIRLSHKVLNTSVASDRVGRYYHAFMALRRYSRAKVVITQRLHVAVPSAAMGVPVVFLKSKKLPGGGGKSGQSRLHGLDLMFHTFEVSDRQDQARLQKFNWKNPPINPGENRRLALRKKLLILVKCHESVLDSAKMFGLVPPVWKVANREHVCDTRELGSNVIHVAVTLDRKWISVLPTWLNAILKNNEGEQLAFHFLTDLMKPSVECVIAEVVKRLSQDTLVFFHTADRILDKIRYRPSSKHRNKISRVTQARLYLSSFLPCLDRVLYLDMDVLVLKNLRKLWDSQLRSSCGIMGRTSSQRGVLQNMASHLNIPAKSLTFKGFNAGVMLLDLRRLRESAFEETLVSYFGEQLGANDQIVYNLNCNGTHDRLPAEWNVFDSGGRRFNDTASNGDDWAIVHFAGSSKPFLSPSRAQMSNRQSFRLWSEYQTTISEILDDGAQG